MMKCLPFRSFKNERFEAKGFIWYNSLTGKACSFNDQPSSLRISPWDGMKYFEWRENGFYQRSYRKPHRVSYKKDGSVHIIDAQGYTKINELKIRDMHRDYHDNWHEYLARYKKI